MKYTFTFSKRKRKRLNFYGMFSQNLSISAAFDATLKITLPQWKAIGVYTLPGFYCTSCCGASKSSKYPNGEEGDLWDKFDPFPGRPFRNSRRACTRSSCRGFEWLQTDTSFAILAGMIPRRQNFLWNIFRINGLEAVRVYLLYFLRS